MITQNKSTIRQRIRYVYGALDDLNQKIVRFSSRQVTKQCMLIAGINTYYQYTVFCAKYSNILLYLYSSAPTCKVARAIQGQYYKQERGRESISYCLVAIIMYTTVQQLSLAIIQGQRQICVMVTFIMLFICVKLYGLIYVASQCTSSQLVFVYMC